MDVVGIIRAGWKGITTGNFSQGASTITQQLIKNSVFTNFTEETKKQTVIRKLQEQYLAVQLERRMSKDDIMMPYVKSEDTATWWNVLRSGHTAFGLDESLTLYRRMGESLSSDKIEAVRRIWNLYRKVEHLGLFYSMYCFVFWAFRAVLRRV